VPLSMQSNSADVLSLIGPGVVRSKALPMASPNLSRRVRKVVGYPPLSEMGDPQHREFHEALLEAATFEDLPGKWQAAILEAEQNRPKLRVVSRD
jgi:hypothetical protein